MRNAVLAVVLAGLASLAGCSPPQSVTKGKFELAVARDLHVVHDGKVLIAGDSLTYGDGWDAGRLHFREKDGIAVVNTVHRGSDVLRYRREAGLSEERLELTCQFRLFPYNNTPDRPSARYAFRVPYERLKTTTYRILDGRASRPKLITGELGETRADGIIAPGAHYAAFKGEDTRLVFDLNPKGLSTNMDYGGGGFIGRWRIEKKGDHVEFAFGYGARFYGGTFAGKALIYEGEYAFNTVHAYRQYWEIGGYQLDRSFSFGTPKPPKTWWRADASPYDAGKGFGWEDASDIRLTRNPGSGLVHNAAYGTGEHVFVRDAVSLRVGGVEAGPFDIALNGETLAKDVAVAQGEVRRIHLRKYIRSGKLRIAFSSQRGWAVSAIVVQPLIYAYEDFVFDRGPWLIENVFTPEG